MVQRNKFLMNMKTEFSRLQRTKLLSKYLYRKDLSDLTLNVGFIVSIVTLKVSDKFRNEY